VQQRWWTAEGTVSRNPGWVAVDVGIALLSAWIAVGESDSTASVDSGPVIVRLAAALWFVTICLRRFGPVTCLWTAGAATVLAAVADQPLTNLSLATALTLAFVFRTRSAPAAGVLAVVPVAAALTALATGPEGRSTWILAVLVMRRLPCGVSALVGRRAAGPGWRSSAGREPWTPSGPGWRWICTTPSDMR
jgi:hypothetical protein